MVLVVVGVLIWQFSTGLRPSPATIPFSQFLQKVESGHVATVVITGSEITGTYTGDAGTGPESKFRSYAPAQYEGLANKLVEKGVGIDAKPESASPWTALLYSWAPILLMIGFWIFIMRQMHRRSSRSSAAAFRRACC
jgi:cell division protease FtsH